MTNRSTSPHPSVLVVGAGPVGLAAALLLRARGLGVTVLEASARGAPRPGSRAIFLHRQSLATLAGADPALGAALVGRGLVWSARSTHYAGREVHRRTYHPPPVHRAPFSALPQPVIEEELRAACVRAGVDVRWEAPVRSLSSAPDGVLVRTPQDVHRAAYAIGCDGARSAVREAIGVRLRGPRSPHTFIVLDVADDPAHPVPAERVFHYRDPRLGGRNVLIAPFRGGVRVDVQCAGRGGEAAADPDDAAAVAASAADWLPALLPEGHPAAVTWSSRYRFQQAVADSFVDAHGRVLLAGEAGHLFAPFGARGLNSGIADAAAAAGALAEGDVAGYADARRRAATLNRRASGRALTHLTSPWSRAAQRLAAASAPRSRRAGRWLDDAPYGPRDAGIPGSKY
ncbi:FAD-dependent monooxygenase [Streptomyces sp. NPDC050617]|uniref:FAD-dependent monooxygenase n=1 Tax=Streptomyces sp. NPDC050617 TaxID=3154628 RepID=UPI00342B9436